MVKPFLKWAGGKSKLAPLLASLAPTRVDRYIEPFIGGGAFLLYLLEQQQIERALISDQLEQQEPHTYPLREVLRGMHAS
jgi:DNA adenine methylase